MRKEIYCLALIPSLLVAQERSTIKTTSESHLSVDLTLSKATFMPNEPIQYRVLLRNIGTSAVYISKSFFEAGGGIAGFYVDLEQLTGELSENAGCGMAGDRFMTNDSRTPRQIQREDFLRLPPGAFVGFESTYGDCTTATTRKPGKYRLTATYVAQDLNTNRVAPVADKNEPVVLGRFKSDPVTFQVANERVR
jgi:hypothetical protein